MLIDIHRVLELVPLSKRQLYRLMSNNEQKFPKPVKMIRRSLWVEEEVSAWVTARKDARTSTAG